MNFGGRGKRPGTVGGEQKILKRTWRNKQILIIDEASMLSLKMLHDIDYKCRKLKGDEAPFGGASYSAISTKCLQLMDMLITGRRWVKRRKRQEYEREDALGGI